MVKVRDADAALLRAQAHPFLVEDMTRKVDMVGWVEKAIVMRDARLRAQIEAAQNSMS